MDICYNIERIVHKKTFTADAVGAKRTWFKSAQVPGHQQDSLSEIALSTRQQSTKGGGYQGCIPFGVHPVPEPGRTRGDGLPDFPQQKDMYYTDWTHPFAEAEDIAEWHERIKGERWQKQNFNETRYYNPAVRPRPNDVGVVVAIGNQSQLPIPPGCTELDHDPCVEKPFSGTKSFKNSWKIN